MADGLVDQHVRGLVILERIDAEYFATRASNPSVGDYERALMGWRGLATAWIVETEALLGSDSLAVSEFRAAVGPASAPPGHSVAWGGIRGGLEAKLEALRKIIGRHRGEPRTGAMGAPSGRGELAALLAQVLEKLPAARLSESEKDDAAQLTRALTQEAAKPGKLSAVGRATATALGHLLTRSAELARVWQAIEPLVRS